MRLLLDSHVFVWVKTAPQNIGSAARAAIIDPDNEVYVSLATAWELWIKHAKRPIAELASVLDGGATAFLSAAHGSGIKLLNITLEHAETASTLPQIHRDPFDRMLIAQTMYEGLTLVTHDDMFDRYGGLRTLKT